MVSNPLIRWVWTGPGNEDYTPILGDFRPSDRESLLEMMQGRYLLASKLVDTNGASPFAGKNCDGLAAQRRLKPQERLQWKVGQLNDREH